MTDHSRSAKVAFATIAKCRTCGSTIRFITKAGRHVAMNPDHTTHKHQGHEA